MNDASRNMNTSLQTTNAPAAAGSHPDQHHPSTIGYLQAWLTEGAEPRDHAMSSRTQAAKAPSKPRKGPIKAPPTAAAEASSAHFSAVMEALAVAEANIGRIRSPRCRWEAIQGLEKLLRELMAEPLGGTAAGC